jgi:hypothetical protein
VKISAVGIKISAVGVKISAVGIKISAVGDKISAVWLKIDVMQVLLAKLKEYGVTYLEGHSHEKVFEITPLNHIIRSKLRYANPSLIFKFVHHIIMMF